MPRRNNLEKHVLQTLFAKLAFFSDFTLILHVFFAERVCFFTISGKVTSLLSTIMFQSKEKQADSNTLFMSLLDN